MHTPSTPTVNLPASATDPRYSTSGILNAQIKEKNRQGLLSTLGGRSGATMDVNKFADAKMRMRDPSSVPVLEQLSKLYAGASSASKAGGVTENTLSSRTTKQNASTYNQKASAVNNMLEEYGVGTGKLAKANVKTETNTFSNPWKNKVETSTVTNKNEIKNSMPGVNKYSYVFNEVSENVKKQKQAAKK